MNCHDDYQNITALLYRSPDFSSYQVASSQTEKVPYDEAMVNLSNSVNRINIAIKDNYFDQAQQGITPLQQQLEQLSESCAGCHKDNSAKKIIMNESKILLNELDQKLDQSDSKLSARKLGAFAVKICARCHSIHRLTYDLKSQFE